MYKKFNFFKFSSKYELECLIRFSNLELKDFAWFWGTFLYVLVDDRAPGGFPILAKSFRAYDEAKVNAASTHRSLCTDQTRNSCATEPTGEGPTSSLASTSNTQIGRSFSIRNSLLIIGQESAHHISVWRDDWVVRLVLHVRVPTSLWHEACSVISEDTARCLLK